MTARHPQPIGRRRVVGPRRAFSLVELMIAIVILGLGLVMVATMFPVAWGRARDLGEFTQHQSITPLAENLAKALLHSPGPSNPITALPTPVGVSFAGDLFYHEAFAAAAVAAAANTAATGVTPSPIPNPSPRIAVDPFNWPNDTWVHAVNMENIRVEDPGFVAEDPWQLERALDPMTDPSPNLDPSVVERSYWNPQINVHQRIHPPLPQRRDIMIDSPLRGTPNDETATFTGDDDSWDDRVGTRRFAWSLLHRLPTVLPPPPTPPSPPSPQGNAAAVNAAVAADAAAAASDRVFDMYYVTLRRPQPTNRYARQDPTGGLPDPYDVTAAPVVPRARPPEDDVMLPVAWRVQVEFPETIVRRFDMTTGIPVDSATNIPTVVQVPPEAFTGSSEAKRMLVTMFPRGTKFIDEITGQIYHVSRIRVEEPLGEKVFLTLDREIFLEDVDFPVDINHPAGDPRCLGVCVVGNLDNEERIRAVWVYPPPVEERDPDNPFPVFSGNTPVVDIEVQTLTVTPDM